MISAHVRHDLSNAVWPDSFFPPPPRKRKESSLARVVSRAKPFTNREGRKESGQIQYTFLLCTVSNLRKEGRDYDVIIHHEFRKNLRSGFFSATWLSKNMITDWRRLFKRVGGGLETAFWSESVGNVSSATPASTWSSSLVDAHPGPCSLFFSYDHQRDLCTQAAPH